MYVEVCALGYGDCSLSVALFMIFEEFSPSDRSIVAGFLQYLGETP